MAFGDIHDLFNKIWVVWLVVVFAALVVYAYWPKNKARFNDDAMIPLREDKERHEER